jgi:hypothetical protein
MSPDPDPRIRNFGKWTQEPITVMTDPLDPDLEYRSECIIVS